MTTNFRYKDNALHSILDYVDFKKQQYMRLMSTHMNSLILENITSMILFQTTDNMSHLFQYCIALKHIQITSLSTKNDVKELCQVIMDGYFQNILILDLQYSRIADSNVKLLCEALQMGKCKKLQVIQLSNNAMGIQGSTALAHCLSRGALPSMRYLDIQHNLIFPEGIKRISRSFTELNRHHIDSLDISRCHLTNAGLSFLCASLNNAPLINLRYLRIYWNSINTKGMNYLAMTISLSILDSLEVFDISKNPIGQQGIAILTESIVRGHHFNNLRVLLLHSCRLGTNGMYCVGLLMKHIKNLQVLAIGNNHIKGRGMLRLFQGFHYELLLHNNLRILDLTNNQIGEEGAYYFASMILNQYFPKLQELSLISNSINDRGLMKIIHVMQYGLLSHLKTLYLTDNNLHDKSVQLLASTLAKRLISPCAELYIGCNHLSDIVIQSLVSQLYSPDNQKPVLKYVILEKKKKDIPDRLIQHSLQNYNPSKQYV